MPRVTSLSLVMVYAVFGAFLASAIAGDDSGQSNKGKSSRVIRDHRTRSNGQGGTTVTSTPIVRDHRQPPVVRDHRTAPIVRDHRARANSQGVTVSNTPVIRDHRTAPIIRDHRTAPIVRDHRDAPIIRDHRTPAKATYPFAKTRRPGKIPPIVRPIDPGRGDGKVIVRDHRERPVVRDHRDRPVIRDHRDAANSPGGTKVTNSPIVRDHRGPIVRDHRATGGLNSLFRD